MLKHSICAVLCIGYVYAEAPHTFAQSAAVKAFFAYQEKSGQCNNGYKEESDFCLKPIYRAGSGKYNSCTMSEVTYGTARQEKLNNPFCSNIFYKPIYIEGSKNYNTTVNGSVLKFGNVIKNNEGISILNDENIYFEMHLLKDRNYGTPNVSKPSTWSARMNRFGIHGNIINYAYDTFKPVAYNHDGFSYAGDSDNRGLGKHYYVWGWREANRLRFNLVDNWKNFVNIKAYVKNGEFNYSTSPKLHKVNNENDLKNDFNYGFTYLNEDIVKKYKNKNRNLLDTVKHAPELITNTREDYNIDNSTATFAIKTVKNCKQDILYEIDVKRIQINGTQTFTIFDSYEGAGESICKNDPKWYDYFKNYKTCTGDTNWDKVSAPTTPESKTKDHVHAPSFPFKFFAIQKGNPNGVDCLENQKADITSAFISKENSFINDKITFEEPKNANTIYAYMNDENVYLKLDFNKISGNAYKSKKDPFVVSNNALISLDIGNRSDFSYYIQYNCDNFNDSNCKYKKMTKQTSLSQINNGYLTYKDLCTELKNKGLSTCDPNETSRQNEVFFKFNNALINFDKINAASKDKSRREFKLRFYSSQGSINNIGTELTHRPIIVRPEYFESYQKACDVFSTNNCDFNIHVTTDELLDNSSLYISEYKFKVDYGHGYSFDLPLDDRKVSFSNPLILKNGDNITRAQAIIPFDTGNIGYIIFKDEHIKHLVESKGYKASDICRDTTYLSKNEANKRVAGMIACQTPMKDEIKVIPTGVNTKIILKDNIDKDGRQSAVITSNKASSDFAYSLYPKLNSSANNHQVAKYYDNDLSIEINPTFDDASIDMNDFNTTLNTPSYNRISNANITKNTNKINVNINKNELNSAFKIVLDRSKNYLDANSNATTKDLISKEAIRNYEKLNIVGVNNNKLTYSSISQASKNSKIAESEENMYEIPIKLTYTKLNPMFTLKEIEIKSNNKSVANLGTSSLGYDNKGINFVYANPIFKDIKVEGSSSAILTKEHVRLHYLNKGNNYDEFNYVNTMDFSSKNCHIKPCYVEGSSKTIPGLDANNLISDYNFLIQNQADGNVKVSLDKNIQYVKDTIRCIGGEYNCNSTFTIEFVK